MKLFLVLFCIVAACRAEVDKEFVMKFVEKIKKVSEECMKETKATPEDIQNLLGHKIPDSHEGKCLIFCFQRHFHIQNEDGSVNKDKTIEALQPIKEHNSDVYEKIVKVLNTCIDEVSKTEDACVYASDLVACGVQEGKSMGLEELLVIDKK